MKNLLFLCTGNSCRSQMAEGWAKHFHSEKYAAFSAGIETHGLNPHALQVMKEAGVDISGHTSKHVDTLRDVNFDVIFTVCGHALDSCPVWLAEGKVIHAGFDDPPKLAAKESRAVEGLVHYRRVRDEIETFVQNIHLYMDN